MPPIDCVVSPTPFRSLVIVADAHLGSRDGDEEVFMEFLEGLLREKPGHLAILGDFFNVWCPIKKFQPSSVKSVLKKLAELTKADWQIYLNTGNRDLFFGKIPFRPSPPDSHPFHIVAPGFLRLDSATGTKVLLHHGDLINSKDLQYLRFRKLIRNPLLRLFVRIFPGKWAIRYGEKIEKRLKQTNAPFRITFPEKEWESFCKKTQSEMEYDFLFCGHYHPKEPIIHEEKNTQSLILPAWMDNKAYLRIREDGNRSLKYFETPIC